MKNLLLILLFHLVLSPAFAQQPTLGLPLGHKDPVGNLKFTKDGKYIVSSSPDGAILWEATTGRMLKRFEEKGYISDSYLYNNEDSNLFVTVNSRTDRIRIEDAISRELIKQIEGTKGQFSPDGRWFITYSNTWAKTSIWTTDSFQLVREFSGYFVGFANPGLILVKSKDYTAFRLDNGETQYTLADERVSIDRLLISPDLNSLVALAKDSLLTILEPSNGEVKREIELQGEIKEIQFSKDNQYLAVSLYAQTSYLISLSKRRYIIQEFSNAEILAMIESSEGNPVMIYQQDSEIIALDLEQQLELYRISNLVDGQCGFAKSPDDRYFLLTVCGDTNPYTVNSYAGASFAMYDSETGRFMHSFASDVNKLRHVEVSSDRKHLTTVAHTAKSQIFDLCNGSLRHVLNTEYAISATFSDDGEYVATTSDMRLVDTGSDLGKEILRQDSRWIWSVATGELIEPIIEDSNGGGYRNYGKEEKYGITRSWDDNPVALIMKYEDGLGDPAQTLTGHRGEITHMEMLDDSLTALTVAKDRTVKIWNIPSGKVTLDLTGFKANVASVVYQYDQKLLLTKTETNQYSIWDLSTGQTLHSFRLPEEKRERVAATSDYRVEYEQEYDDLGVFNVGTGQKLFTLRDHLDLISEFQFIPGTNYLVTSSYDGSIIIWDLEKGRKVLQQFIFNNKEPIWLLPDGYYFASREAASKLYYIQGLQTIGFEQLDVKYNRPDKVLEVLGKVTGCNNRPLIRAYRKAWQKRVRKLNIDTTSFQQGFSVPQTEILNRNEIKYQQTSDMLTLKIKASDSLYSIDRFNLWVNEVPLFGRNGISMASRGVHSLDTAIAVPLSDGSNKIEASILNVNGVESYRTPLYVNFIPKKENKENLYFVGIGIDHYKEAGHDLNYSVKDIRDLSVQLKGRYGDQIQIDTLFDEDVTVENVMRLRRRLLSTGVNDKVIVSFSGHGLLSLDLDYFLATHTMDFDNPGKNGLPYEDLETLLDSIPARQKLMLIDACHSGEVDKQEVEIIARTEKSLSGVKGTGAIVSKRPELGMKNSFELMKELFNNIDRATGATVISAASGTQFALERGDLENGVFTYCILKELQQNGSMSVSQLKELVFQQVPELTGGLQQPTSRNETIENDWMVWE
jgi:WD40 repeat protein